MSSNVAARRYDRVTRPVAAARTREPDGAVKVVPVRRNPGRDTVRRAAIVASRFGYDA